MTDKQRKKIEEAVFEAIGAASMCWIETPKGVFNDIKAKEISNDLLKKIVDNLIQEESRWIPMEERLPEQGAMVWFIHSGDFLAHGNFGAGYRDNELHMWFTVCKKSDFEIPLSKVSLWQPMYIPNKPLPSSPPKINS